LNAAPQGGCKEDLAMARNLSTMFGIQRDRALMILSREIEVQGLQSPINLRVALVDDEFSEADFNHQESLSDNPKFEKVVQIDWYDWKIGCHYELPSC
jgi:hypothetical protein